MIITLKVKLDKQEGPDCEESDVLYALFECIDGIDVEVVDSIYLVTDVGTE
jgi:hypothetical protein